MYTPIKFLTTPPGVKLPQGHDVQKFVGQQITIAGHVSWFSETKGCKFARIYDSWQTQLFPIQLVFFKKGTHEDGTPIFDAETLALISKIQKGWHVCVTGTFVTSPKEGQPHELQVKKIESFGELVDYDKYPLAGDDYTLHGLHDHPEHQAKSPIFSTIWGISSELTKMVHQFFDEQEFTQIYTPLITFAECESGCQPLQITQLFKDGLIWKLPRTDTDSKVDTKYDFFGKPAFLTVSGQLEVRTCLAMGPVWTLTTAVRGEHSVTGRHLGEFRMIEPEFQSPDEKYAATVAEKFVVYCIRGILDKFKPYLEFLASQSKFGFDSDRVQKLERYVSRPFVRITHAQAITLLREHHATTPFKEEPKYDDDLAGEHEKWLTDEKFKHPVIVLRYPEKIKSFYMPEVEETEEESCGVKHVGCFDILVPDVGELVGGSQREHSYAKLMKKIADRGMDPKPLMFFTETMKHGSHPHAGFGMGYERLVMLLCGCRIHDTIPFPRAYDGKSFVPGSSEIKDFQQPDSDVQSSGSAADSAKAACGSPTVSSGSLDQSKDVVHKLKHQTSSDAIYMCH
jgi:asparaginyl-tRNA synthetase